jgi:hypothetical protein
MLNQKTLWALSGVALLAALILGYLAWRDSRTASVVVEWSTASELNTAGFNLYRSENPDGPFAKINDDLIPASPDPLTGGSYSYTDKNVSTGQTYYYQLEDVEISGGANRTEDTVKVKASGGGLMEFLLAIGFAIVSVVGLINSFSKRKVPEPV